MGTGQVSFAKCPDVVEDLLIDDFLQQLQLADQDNLVKAVKATKLKTQPTEAKVEPSNNSEQVQFHPQVFYKRKMSYLDLVNSLPNLLDQLLQRSCFLQF